MVLFVSIAWLHHRGTLSGLALPWFVICHTLFFKCILLARTQSNNIISMNLVGNNAESTESWIHVPEWKALSLCPGALLYVCVCWCQTSVCHAAHQSLLWTSTNVSLHLSVWCQIRVLHTMDALSASATTFLSCRNTTQLVIKKLHYYYYWWKKEGCYGLCIQEYIESMTWESNQWP